MYSPDPVLSVLNVQVSYREQGRVFSRCGFSGRKKEPTPVLRDINFKIFPGDRVAIMGESGCGKSTLLRVIAGLHRPDKGEVICGGMSVRAPGRDRMVVFQGFEQLYPCKTVMGNILVAITLGRKARADELEKARHFLNLVGLSHKENAYPCELSGGQKQRVAIACALAVEPRILLMDEPFSAIDPGLKEEIRSELIDVFDRLGTTVLLVTHCFQEAEAMSERILFLEGSPASIAVGISSKDSKKRLLRELQHA